MKKKILAVLLSAVMCVSVFAGCGSKETGKTQDAAAEQSEAGETAEAEETAATEEEAAQDPMEKIVDSRYCFAYPVEGMDDMVQYFHFYGDNLGIGAVFYASYAWNQITFSGTYTIEKKDFAYEVAEEKPAEGEAELVSGTAPYTITFYDWDGAELDKAGYDGEYFYNTTAKINTDPMTGGGNYRMGYVDEAVYEQYKSSFEAEVGTAYISFTNPEDASATLALNTNGTYNDMVVMAVDGTWVQTGEGQYTLTPDSDSDNGAEVAVQEDGTYLYKSEDGTEVVLAQDMDAEEAFLFSGTFLIGEMEANLMIQTYADGTVKVNAGMGEMSMEVDAGTYTVAEDGFTYNFTFDNAGEIVSELGGETGVQVTYPASALASIGGTEDVVCGVVLE